MRTRAHHGLVTPAFALCALAASAAVGFSPACSSDTNQRPPTFTTGTGGESASSTTASSGSGGAGGATASGATGTGGTGGTGGGQPDTCGNNTKDGTEACDGSDLGGATCQSQGFSSGTLACSASCAFDTSGCSCNGTSGCYACPPSTTTQFLNACTTAQCSPFDNVARLPLYNNGNLPPLP